MRSPALAAIEAVHDSLPRRSSARVADSATWNVIRLAIVSGMRWDLGDLGRIISRRWYLFGYDSVEHFYSLACGSRHGEKLVNVSACRTVESYLERPPFWFWDYNIYGDAPTKPKRAAVGTRFWWPPEQMSLHVTSFSDDKMIACAYREWETDPALKCAHRIAVEHLGRLWRGAGRDAPPLDLKSFESWDPQSWDPDSEEFAVDEGEVLSFLRQIHVQDYVRYSKRIKRRIRFDRSLLKEGGRPHAA